MTHSRFATMRRRATSVVLAFGIILAGATSASAHISVDAGSARQGEEDAVLTFRVPNERTGATTVKLDIKFPGKTPIATVKPAPKEGWTVTTKREQLATPIKTVDGEITKAVSQVTYTANSRDDGIPEDAFGMFQMLVGPLPSDADTISFPTVQTYSTGDVSAWIEPSVPGSETEHPAPVLRLLPAGGPEGTNGVNVSTGTSAGSDSVATQAQVKTASYIGIVAVVLGCLALLGAGVAIGRSRRQ